MKQNREAIIEQLLIDNYESYYRLAFSYIHNEADAMDIVQEGAYKAILKSESLENMDFAGTWVYRIMLNEVFSTLRRQKYTGQNLFAGVETDAMLHSLPDDMTVTEDVVDSLTLQEALDGLPPEDKLVVQLRYFEDRKLDEIATLLGENLSTVKSRLYRSLKKLRLHLEQE